MPALTAFRTERRYADAEGRPLALLRCSPRTGRQHQIRAHLRAAGFPLVGDKLYGPDENIFLKLAESGRSPPPRGEFDPLLTPEERRALRHVRHALHADELSLPHPSSGERMRFSAPLPEDLRALIAGLRPLDSAEGHRCSGPSASARRGQSPLLRTEPDQICGDPPQ
jgi:23S rRNA pseudouridine1911/1915/1917 synthase